MADLEGFDIDIVACPIVREPDGLALSSRNVRLTPEQRAMAPAIYRSLKASLDMDRSIYGVEDVKRSVVDAIDSVEFLTTEYYEIVNPLTMQPVADWNDCTDPVGCITVYCGDVRLIDNITYKSK